MQRRAEIRGSLRKSPRPEEFNGTYDLNEELLGDTLEWPLASSYILWQGKIYPNPGRERRFPPRSPLSRSDLFLSFTRLGAQGDPDENRIKDWVSRNGLLTRKYETLDGAAILEDRMVNQQPITLDAFREEVARARTLLILYTEIRHRDVQALVYRSQQPQTSVDRELASYLSSDAAPEKRMEILLGPPVPPMLSVADKVLSDKVSASVSSVGLRAAPGFQPPIMTTDEGMSSHVKTVLANYRIGQAYNCPDLLSAMYLQFYFLITQNRPVRRCEMCATPFPITRKDKRFCNATCRSNARNYR